MDFLLLIATEIAANSCAPYACIGPNARPADSAEPPQTIEIVVPMPTPVIPPCITTRGGVEMSCETSAYLDAIK